MKFRQLRKDFRLLLLETHIRLNDRTRITPDVLASRNNCLGKVLDFRHSLINGGPASIELVTFQQLHPFLCLDPHFIDHRQIRLPRLVGPFRIGNPNVLGSIHEQRRINDFNKDVDFSLGALRIEVWNVSDLNVFSKYMDEHTMKNKDVL